MLFVKFHIVLSELARSYLLIAYCLAPRIPPYSKCTDSHLALIKLSSKVGRNYSYRLPISQRPSEQLFLNQLHFSLVFKGIQSSGGGSANSKSGCARGQYELSCGKIYQKDLSGYDIGSEARVGSGSTNGKAL